MTPEGFDQRVENVDSSSALRAVNETLRNCNEELTGINDELRSINDRLSISNEEGVVAHASLTQQCAEDARDHAEELGAIYAMAGVGFATIDERFNVRTSNKQFDSQLTHQDERSLSADGEMNLANVLPRDLLKAIEPSLSDIAANRRSSFKMDTKGRIPGGAWRSWRVSVRRTSDRLADGGFALSLDDITDRVEKDSRALKGRAVLRALGDAVEAFTGVCDRQGRLIECNRQFLGVIEAQLKDVVCDTLDQAPWWRHDEETRSTIRTSIQLALQGESVSHALTYQRKNGEVRHMDFHAGPMHDAVGEVHQVVISGFDTEEQYQTLEQLRKANRHLEIALQSGQLGTWWWYTDSEELIWDLAQRALWGFDAEEEVIIETAMGRIHQDDREGVAQKMKSAIASRTTFEDRFRIVLKDGSIRRLGAHAQAFFDEATKRNCLVGVNWNTSADYERSMELLEAKRQAESANIAKSEFLTNMSHEIRTPMTAILGYADILAKHTSDPDGAALVETIRRSGRFLLQILNDILDLAKIESGALSMVASPTPPESVVKEAVSLMLGRAEAKGIELLVDCDRELPETVDCDPIRLRQVLLNLLSNAIKFTDEGRVTLRVVANDSSLMFEVIDSGIGIPEESLATLFEPFTQVDSSTQRERGGTGLGLTISRRFCRAMSGDLTVTSRPNQGSTFTVCLPAQGVRSIRTSAHFYAPPPPSEIDTSPEPNLAGCRVMIVDDRREVRALIQYMFEEAGAEVVLAAHGREAINHYNASCSESGEPIELIVMDMQMPVMDGYAATAALREQGCLLPIIALTAHAMRGELEKCLASGCSEFATKPIDGDHLIAMAERLLKSSRG